MLLAYLNVFHLLDNAIEVAAKKVMLAVVVVIDDLVAPLAANHGLVHVLVLAGFDVEGVVISRAEAIGHDLVEDLVLEPFRRMVSVVVAEMQVSGRDSQSKAGSVQPDLAITTNHLEGIDGGVAVLLW